jgi:hypothetical protein
VTITSRAVERGGAALAIGLWAISLALPAAAIAGGPVFRGSDLLLRGWQALDSGVYAWLANPLFILAAGLCAGGVPRLARAVVVLALLLAVTSFSAAAVLERAGTTVPDFTFASGLYVWLAAFVVLLLSCLAHYVLPVDPPRAPP